METLARKIADRCVSGAVVKEKNREIVAFGINQILFFLSVFMVVNGIGLMIGQLYKSIIYCAVYFSMNGLTGGYHAKTRFQCFLKTIIVFCGYLVLTSIVPETLYFYLSLMSFIVYSVIAYFLAPVKHKNLPLSSAQIKEKRKKLLIRSALWIVLSGILFVKEQTVHYAVAVSVAFLFIGILAGFGYLFNE